MTNCDYCGKIEKTPKGYDRNFCDSCIRDKEIGFANIIKTMNVAGYGAVSANRVKALESRIMLPMERRDGKSDYFIGTRIGNKILEREPDCRP